MPLQMQFMHHQLQCKNVFCWKQPNIVLLFNLIYLIKGKNLTKEMYTYNKGQDKFVPYTE